MAKRKGQNTLLSYYEKKPNCKCDAILFNIVLILVCSGLIMCFSASAPNAKVQLGDSYYFLRKQAIWGTIGLFAMLFAMKFNYKVYKDYAGPVFIITVIMLIIVLFMPKVNGARRWIGIGGASFQPSEVAKFALIILFAKKLEIENWKGKHNYKKLLFGYWFVFGIFALLLMLEPHFSCTVLIGMVALIMLFVSNVKIKDLFASILTLSPLALLLAFLKGGYRILRLKTFFSNENADITKEAWQITQSLYAIGSGGLVGLGLGKSRQKYMYLPEPQNDFIFAIICEELGFVGALLVIILFGLLIWRGIVIAVNVKNKFAALVAAGITGLITVQVLINIAVVTQSMPVTGMPLPFFSAGGSSLVFTMFEMGVLLNISTHIEDEE